MLKGLVYLSLATTFVVLVSIGSNIYHNSTTSDISRITSIENVPITPSFDMKTVDKIGLRQEILVNLESKIEASSSTSVSAKETTKKTTTNTASVNSVE